MEDRVLHVYYDELTDPSTDKVSKEEYSWKEFREDYAQGGAGRWMWMLCVLTSMCPDRMVQYFHDQVAAFVEDHGINAESICMPRV